MFGLIPKEEKFFSMFQDMTKNIVNGALLLKEMLDHFQNPLESQQKIKEIEHIGDAKTHDIFQKLNTSFITPFDREDIYALASALDNILDMIDTCAQHIIMYRIEKITPEAKELGFIIAKSCQTIEKAVAVLGNKTKTISEYCVEVNSLENEADRVRADAITRLFDETTDPIYLIKWKEVYENLEAVTDKCEDAVYIMESMILKNA